MHRLVSRVFAAERQVGAGFVTIALRRHGARSVVTAAAAALLALSGLMAPMQAQAEVYAKDQQGRGGWRQGDAGR